VGGGVLMVPVLLELFRLWGVPSEVVVQTAMGTSFAVIVFSVSSSTIRHHRQKNVLWKVVPMLAAGSMIGGWVASSTANNVAGNTLQLILAGILFLVSMRMFFERPYDDKPMHSLAFPVWMLIGVGVGVFAGFSGLAGGVVMIPAMAFLARVPTRNLAATASAVNILTALSAVMPKLLKTPLVDPGPGFFNYVNWIAVLCLAAMSIPFAQLGARLNRKAGSMLYKRVFAVVLLIVVVRLFLTA
jgi:uncharacterized membrane protein YfcA